MEETELRQEMVAACRRMNDIGLNQGTSGNISARCGDKILITPTSLPYDEMMPEDIVAMDAMVTLKGDASLRPNGASIMIS